MYPDPNVSDGFLYTKQFCSAIDIFKNTILWEEVVLTRPFDRWHKCKRVL